MSVVLAEARAVKPLSICLSTAGREELTLLEGMVDFGSYREYAHGLFDSLNRLGKMVRISSNGTDLFESQEGEDAETRRAAIASSQLLIAEVSIPSPYLDLDARFACGQGIPVLGIYNPGNRLAVDTRLLPHLTKLIECKDPANIGALIQENLPELFNNGK